MVKKMKIKILNSSSLVLGNRKKNYNLEDNIFFLPVQNMN